MADTDLMGELALHGKFVEIPERLFYRRVHAAAFSAARDDDAHQTYFWSANAGQFTLPTRRRNMAVSKAIRRAPIEFDEKRRLAIYMLRRLYWGKRELVRELLAFMDRRGGPVTPRTG